MLLDLRLASPCQVTKRPSDVPDLINGICHSFADSICSMNEGHIFFQEGSVVDELRSIDQGTAHLVAKIVVSIEYRV